MAIWRHVAEKRGLEPGALPRQAEWYLVTRRRRGRREIMPSPAPLRRGTYYHIYNRGNNRENLFVENGNYTYFLERYFKYIEPVACTYAYCLMRNHFHLLIRTKAEEEQHQTGSTIGARCACSHRAPAACACRKSPAITFRWSPISDCADPDRRVVTGAGRPGAGRGSM